VPELIAPLARFACGGKDSVHGAGGTEVFLLVEEDGEDLCWSLVDEAG